jgi:hypothetical protein
MRIAEIYPDNSDTLSDAFNIVRTCDEPIFVKQYSRGDNQIGNAKGNSKHKLRHRGKTRSSRSISVWNGWYSGTPLLRSQLDTGANNIRHSKGKAHSSQGEGRNSLQRMQIIQVH